MSDKAGLGNYHVNSCWLLEPVPIKVQSTKFAGGPRHQRNKSVMNQAGHSEKGN